MSGEDEAVPCQWDNIYMKCDGRLDCSFKAPSNDTACPEMPTMQAMSNNCGLHINQQDCTSKYTMKRMTGAMFQFPCVWAGMCKADYNCGEKQMKAPTRMPSSPPTMTPTTVPSWSPTVVPTWQP